VLPEVNGFCDNSDAVFSFFFIVLSDNFLGISLIKWGLVLIHSLFLTILILLL